MIFVVAFDRSSNELLAFDRFGNSERTAAELRYRQLLKRDWFEKRSGTTEVNMFESEDEETFRQTHSRYFLTTSALIESLRETLPE